MVQVPHGNTQKNVNRNVYQAILPALQKNSSLVLVDVPCGAGWFGEYVQQNHANVKIIGADLFEDASSKIKNFYKADAITFLSTLCPKDVDIITCISGVMCFGKTGGTLVVTNDNVHAIRDRISFFFFGYLKRFKPFYAPNEGNWNVVLPQEIVMHMERNGFSDIKFNYTSFYFEDLIFLPIALVLFPLSVLGLLPRAKWNLKKVLSIYSFGMLMNRHYVVSAKR